MGMVERFVVIGVILIGAYLLFRLSLLYVKKKEEKMQAREEQENIKIIRSPALWFLSGVVCTAFCVFFVIMTILSSFGLIFGYEEDAYFLSVFILPFLILGIGIILMYTTWRVEIRETDLLYCDMIGRKKIYRYDEIEMEPFAGGEKIYKNGKYQFKVTIHAKNDESLYEAYEAYQDEQRRKKRELKKQEKKG